MDTKLLEGMWTTRPIRPQTGRTISGVCVGIGNRYRVDPTLVKVAFVVAAMFGGSGILVYIAAILVLPTERRLSSSAAQIAVAQWYATHPHLSYDQWRRSHADLGLPALDGLARHGLRRPHVIGLIILAVIVVSSMGPDSTWSSSGLVGVALLAIGWWLLHRRTPIPPPGTSVDTYRQVLAQAMASPTPVVPGSAMPYSPERPVATPGSESASPAGASTHSTGGAAVDVGKSGVDMTKSGVPAAASTTDLPPLAPEPLPPAWDPLGTAKFAWDLPEPKPRAEVALRDKSRSPMTLVTVGIAVLVATSASAAALAGVGWFTPARIVALGLAVLGVGLVAGGLRKTTGKHAPGLVPLAMISIAAVIALSSASNFSLPSGGVGDRVWTPTSESDLQALYTLGMGSQTLDLRSVKLTAARTVEVRNGVGEVVIRVPSSMAVDSRCTADVGSVQCPGGHSGPSGSPVLTVTAHTNVGQVRMSRE
ncbi:PspC domain-containing protein [Gordonia sp. TBRC 11910]|uniref:PspC domain-containing protein n=1 Tax=Gordonia asplenii TaxID=2725283 RepID=A0A848KVV6_9ACTN|nr:PspC domain-containing protein [Gordonia asplenii]NMO01005.1 PspC domain-containing protein [Gordonia asplenii]